jgi:hypothetical protein
MHGKEENLTVNHITPVSEIYTKQSINEENSSLFMIAVWDVLTIAEPLAIKISKTEL